MIRRLLVANRGEIARRIFRTCREMGIATLAVYSKVDADAPFVREADEAVPLGGASPAESYLRADAIVAAARHVGADAIHPGYGFLAEDGGFARLCEEAGLTFVGPPAAVVEKLGSKLEAKRLAASVGVPALLPDGPRPSFPVLVKAAAGGGGRGMRLVERPEDLETAMASAEREAEAAFGDGTVFLEPYLVAPHHVEIQLFGDRHGRVISLFERDCSIQRRHQKVLEESPSPAISADLRARLSAAAVALGSAAGYIGAGTVEFLVDREGGFYLLEVNTRLQVEHAVTEAVTGLDLVRLQLEVAAGERLPSGPFEQRGHAIEVRLFAEDPLNGWAPAVGRLACFEIPTNAAVRVDSAVETGSEVSLHYDSLLAKVVAHARKREEAAALLQAALARARIHGLATNRDLLVRLLQDQEFLSGRTDTAFFDRRRPTELGRPLIDCSGARLHAAAAALAGERRRRSEAQVQRSLPSGWRNAFSEMQRSTFTGNAETFDVGYRITRNEVDLEVCGEPLKATVAMAAPDAVVLIADGIRRQYDVQRVGSTVHVDSSLGYTELVELDRFPAPSRKEPAGSLQATLPGIVIRIHVALGDRVRPGQELIVVEAMKMEHRIIGDRTGRVLELRVQEGQIVAAGQVLIVIEPEEDL